MTKTRRSPKKSSRASGTRSHTSSKMQKFQNSLRDAIANYERYKSQRYRINAVMKPALQHHIRNELHTGANALASLRHDPVVARQQALEASEALMELKDNHMPEYSSSSDSDISPSPRSMSAYSRVPSGMSAFSRINNMPALPPRVSAVSHAPALPPRVSALQPRNSPELPRGQSAFSLIKKNFNV